MSVNWQTSGKRDRHHAGATFVEALVSLPIIILLILAFFDFARLITLELIFTHSLQQAADLAAKLDLDQDVRSSNCGGEREAECALYSGRLQKVLNVATRMLDSVSGPSGSGSFATRARHVMYHRSVYPSDDSRNAPHSSVVEMVSDVGILRPGERTLIRWEGVDGAPDEPYDHPSRPFGEDPGQGWPDVNAGENWQDLMLREPIVLRVDYGFDWITPFIPTMRRSVAVVSYRKAKRFVVGGSAVRITPGAAPTNTPRPTPVDEAPTPTPLPAATVPAPTATPTPVDDVCRSALCEAASASDCMFRGSPACDLCSSCGCGPCSQPPESAG